MTSDEQLPECFRIAIAYCTVAYSFTSTSDLRVRDYRLITFSYVVCVGLFCRQISSEGERLMSDEPKQPAEEATEQQTTAEQQAPEAAGASGSSEPETDTPPAAAQEGEEKASA